MWDPRRKRRVADWCKIKRHELYKLSGRNNHKISLKYANVVYDPPPVAKISKGFASTIVQKL